jgi:hypothetical protein
MARRGKTHCCVMMTDNVENSCEDHPDRNDCPDMLIDYWPSSNRYGIMIHDGAASMIVIAFCPWCGTRLGKT